MESKDKNSIRNSPEFKHTEKHIKGFTIAAFVFMGLGVLAFILFWIPSLWPDSLAQRLGDYTGGTIASLWSFAGVILIYVAFLKQKQQLLVQEEELRYSREELEATREELKGQKEQLEAQNSNLLAQRVDNTFFNLIEDFTKGIESLSYPRTNFVGYACIVALRNDYRGYYNRKKEELASAEVDLDIEKVIKESMMEFLKKSLSLVHGIDVTLLIDQVYLILSFIENNVPIGSSKEFYQRLFMTKLRKELVTLALYRAYLFPNPHQKIQPLLHCLNLDSKGSVRRFLIDPEHDRFFQYDGW